MATSLSTYVPTYLPTCMHSDPALTAYDQSLPQRPKLASYPHKGVALGGVRLNFSKKDKK